MVRSDMDVRCERCKTEYEFDDARITEAGVTVKCTTCEHVFKVKKKALVVTVPVRPGELEQVSQLSQAPSQPAPAGVAPNREWRVRQASGNLFTFKELTTLQKWIVERKVSRDDEISLNGESWKRLGNIAELSSFFQVVDDALKAQQLMALQQQGLFGQQPPAPSAGPLPQVPAGPPVLATPAPAAAQAPAPLPPSAAPAPIPPPPDRSAVRSAARPGQEKSSGGAGKWVLVVLLLGALGGGGYYGYQFHWLPMQAQKQVAPPVAVTPVPPLPPEEAQGEGESVAETEPASPAREDAGAPEAIAAETPDAGQATAEADAEVEPEPTAVAAAEGELEPKEEPEAEPAPEVKPVVAEKPKPRVLNFDQLLVQADRLRLRDRPDLAIESYEKAMALKPMRAEPVAGRGLALMDLGERASAETAFREALRLNPRYAVAVMGLAETYRQQGKKTEALAQYQRYLDILPNGPEAAVARANIERLKE